MHTAKIKSVTALKKYQQELKEVENSIKIKVAMATCSNAAGAIELMDFLKEVLTKRGINAMLSKTGCMGYCYAEPTIEVTLPDHEPVVFGHVDIARADLIIEQYMKKGEPVEGVIPVNYKTVEEPFNQ